MTKKKATPDDKVMELLATVKRQREAIAKAEHPVYKTNRTFSFTDGDLNKAVNIATVLDVAALIKMAAYVQMNASEYHVMWSAILCLDEAPPFTWCGFSDGDWTHDIKLRISQIRIKAQRDKLAVLEARLDSILSPERRHELELLAIERELTK